MIVFRVEKTKDFTVMNQWSFTAIWYCNAPYADL